MEDTLNRDAGRSDGRPSPDALLEAAGQAGRGRLKLFLGAAPGVGKTFEMLTAAQAKRLDGIDVAVGVVETHGRAETEALLRGLPMIPRRQVEYKGHHLTEMDLDAILARRPRLVLVDELAHTNAAGSRHAKRYMDVEELLAAGIDVYTTLNIQHVESLTDVVAQITRIRVRETVPDSVIDRADEIELIDLTPEDLIQRLKDGKVYVPRQADRAIRHYFLPGNLTALRELALRRTAQRVDAQMVNYMRSHAIQGPWAASERVLVCIDDNPAGSAVVRHARRFADRMRAPWTAIHVETARAPRLSETRQDRIAEALRLAQRLGGEAVTIPGQDVADTVVEYARANNFTHIIIAKSRRARWRSLLLHGAVERRLIAHAGDLNIHLLAAAPEAPGEAGVKPAAQSRAPFDLRGHGGSVAIVAAGLAVSLVLRHVLAVSDVALVFLTAVLASAITYGLLPSLLACLVSVLAYNFFFLPPLYTFTIADPENVVTLFFFAVVALIASNLTARVRAQAIAARARAKTTEELYQFSRKLAVAVDLDDLLWATAHQIALMLKVRVVLLLPDGQSIAVRAGYPPEDVLAEADLAAAKWCWQNTRAAGRGADTLPGAKWLFLPMRTGRGTVGVVGIDRDDPAPPLSPDQLRLLNALSDQAALAIERVNLAGDVDRARLAAETDRLRAALLTSISHDLRTPLASILGSASSLSAHDAALDPAVREGLARTIQEEAERLNRFIGNLLDMTRLEAGRVSPAAGLADLSDVVGAVLQRAEKILAHHRVQVDLQADLPMLDIDVVLFEQVLFNLLDNAAKYAPAASVITLRAWSGAKRVRLEVMDEGEGIPPADLERIFDKFYRARAADHRRAGTGLGLAICRGFMEAMGGTVMAANRTDRAGAVFTLALPIPAQAELPPETAP
ncbi:MAG TPA: sensor histidine kinase KdpD [Acetobacteraceae bacterium]|nr:sensor histidine kinase KdpD [Acetobacteraceae bacterium]